MVGASIGDVIGSRHEFNNIKTKDFQLFTKECSFTDDTVMTCAVAEALMYSLDRDGNFDRLSERTIEVMRAVGQLYPYCGYGGRFFRWMFYENPKPYNSYGNGAAMRVSPVAYVAQDEKELKELAYKVTAITHNHPEGLKGAEATALAVYHSLWGMSKDRLKEDVLSKYYVPEHTVDGYRAIIRGHGEETCQVSMPEALQCFYDGGSYEDVIRNCVSIGGDSDTLGAIAGAMAAAYYGIPEDTVKEGLSYLDSGLFDIVCRFDEFIKKKYGGTIIGTTLG